MEFLKGGELCDFWTSRPDCKLTEREAKEVMLQLLSAIEYCHSMKIIHRDIKFQNILLAKPYDPESDNSEFMNIELKVVDFGIFGTSRG